MSYTACVKCNHERLYAVKPFQLRNYEYTNSTNPMPIATGYESRDDIGSLELRICAACGYAEWWAMELRALKKAAEAGALNVRVVDVAAGYR